MPNVMARALPWFAIAAAVVAADQLTKWLALAYLKAPVVVAPFFNLVLVYNKGAAFSFLAQADGWQTPLLSGFALIAAGVVTYLILKSPEKRLMCAGLA